MANLASYKRNSKVKAEGVWKQPDPDRDLRIKSRGYPDEYHDLQAAKQKKAAKGFGGDTSKLPVAMTRKINVECLIATSLIDVEMKDDDGNAVTFEEFCDALRDPDNVDLINLAFASANMADSEREDDLKEASGN